MWTASSPRPIPRPFLMPAKPILPLAVSASANVPQPSRNTRASQTSKQQQQQQRNPKREEGEEAETPTEDVRTKQLSGLDVLWAMQRAAAEKTNKESSGGGGKKNHKRKGKLASSACGHRREEKGAIDFSNVRPLCIKSEWGVRLDELEKRLRELSPSLPHIK